MSEHDYAQLTRWLNTQLEDADLTRELLAVRNDEREVHERFRASLGFGTAGLRGELGAGTNRMNIHTVRRATQGFASFLLRENPSPSVAVSYDSRHKSGRFALETAAVMAGNGVHVYLYREMMPTPMLSFAVLDRSCDGGVMVTASHNPARYNGYKVYGRDGAQISGEAAEAIAGEMERTDVFDGIRRADFDAALRDGRIEYIDEALVERYYDAVLRQALQPGICRAARLKVVYTPLNGTGRVPVLEVLSRIGVSDVTTVPEQELPDGDFPTCPYPNPENPEAMRPGLRLTGRIGADLLLATDPDSDRVGAAVMENGGPRLISGNEMGVLLLDYICRIRERLGRMPDRPVAVRSLVSTTMADEVAGRYRVEMRPVLTGFKYIGEQIANLEAEGHPERFLFGFEESCGYLSGNYVRDKDAVSACLLICEMTAWYKTRGKTLGEALDSLYEEYGSHYSRADGYVFAGSDGMDRMGRLMNALRDSRWTEIAGLPVTMTADYQSGIREAGGRREPTGLPASNVIEYGLGDAGSVIVRPSGTEPKLKVYYTLKADSGEAGRALYASVRGWMEKKLNLSM